MKLGAWLAVICLLSFTLTTVLVGRVAYIGGSEDGNYALLGERLAEGKGFTTDVIGFYYTPYDAIEHPDDTAPPLYPFLVALFFTFFGKLAIMAKLPAIFFGLVALPLAVFLFGTEVKNARVGFIAGLLTLFSPLNFPTIVHAEAEPLFATFVVLTAFFFIKGLKDGRWFYAMGVALALAFLAKYTAVLIVGTVFVAYAVILLRKKVKFSMHFVGGMLLSAIIVAPWCIRNILLFGTPMYTVHRFIAPYLGLLPPARMTLGTGPTYFDAVRQVGLAALVSKAFHELIRMLMTPLTAVYLLAVAGLWRMDLTKRAIITGFAMFMLVFHAVYWYYSPSYAISVLALLIVPAVAFLDDKFPRAFPRVVAFVAIALLIFLSGKFFVTVTLDGRFGAVTEFPFTDTEQTLDTLAAASWVKTAIPTGEPVFVRQNPWGFAFHSGHPALAMPDQSGEGWLAIVKLAQQYGVRYTQCDVDLVPIDENVELLYSDGLSFCRIR